MNTASRQEGGFTAVEMLVSIIMVGLIFGAFATTFATFSNIIVKSKVINSVNQAAYAKIQEYENRSFASLPNPGAGLMEIEDFSSTLPTFIPAPRSGKVFIESVSATLKRVVVTIAYGPPTQRTFEYVTYIQENGLGR